MRELANVFRESARPESHRLLRFLVSLSGSFLTGQRRDVFIAAALEGTLLVLGIEQLGRSAFLTTIDRPGFRGQRLNLDKALGCVAIEGVSLVVRCQA